MVASKVLPWVLIAAAFGSSCRSDPELPTVLPPEPVDTWIVVGCEELAVGDARFYGRVDPVVGEMTYTRFGVSLVRDPRGVGTPTFLKVGNQQIRLRDATPETLSAVGFPEQRPHPPRRLFGVFGGNGRSDAGVDLVYSGDKAEALSARCYRGETCDFAFGWDGYPMITLPVRASILEKALPAAGTVRACRSTF